MAGLGAVVVGYREGNRQIQRLKDEHGLDAVECGKCIAGCNYPVYFVLSGRDAIRYRDAQIMCDECYDLYEAQIEAEL